MIGCSLNCAKARARNLICCKSLISVLPPLIICNKFPIDFYPTNSDNVGIANSIRRINKQTFREPQNHHFSMSRIPRNSKNNNEFKLFSLGVYWTLKIHQKLGLLWKFKIEKVI